MQTSPRAAVLGAALVLLLALSACTSSNATRPTSGATLDTSAFAAYAEQDDVILLDVRTPAEFSDGHLEGALNLDLTAPTFVTDLDSLDPDARYAVYCRTGNRSAEAMTLMQAAGIETVAHLGGGIVEWTDEGREVVTAQP